MQINPYDQNSFPQIYSLDKKVLILSDRLIDKDTFTSHCLFKATKEKDSVYQELLAFQNSSKFTQKYQIFLENIKKEDWYNYYESNYKELSLLSILAFFDNKIDQEELIVTHMVAYAFLEYELQKNVIGINIFTLYPKISAEYLKKAGFPLFANNSDQLQPIITNVKSEEEMVLERNKFVKELSILSPIKRTVIEYTLAPFSKGIEFGDDYAYPVLEQRTYYELNWRMGYKDVAYNEATIVLLSPLIAINLGRKATNNKTIEPSTHYYMFGYSEEDAVLDDGVRMISIPSPLFESPYVHDYREGSTGFQIYFHDVYFHVILDFNNPHIPIFIKVANSLLEEAKTEISEKRKLAMKSLAAELKDREINQYRYLNPEEAFFKGLVYKYHLIQETTHFETNDEHFMNNEATFVTWVFSKLDDNEKQQLQIATIEDVNKLLEA